uniref:NADH-ubiquinone oxidoreductase chain 4L n=1 Tax=Bambusiphaga luodianensis TaxID=871414 RepID=A0A7S4Z1C3_9HEMI|nr:NADH dehydrogenase subunit 4L [Bambusiphaga luodianensis]
MTYIFFYIFVFSSLSIFFVRSHYLLTLICMELIFLILFFFFFFYMNFFGFEGYFGLIFLILGVCEASLGLTMLVYLVRKVSFDYLDSFNLC